MGLTLGGAPRSARASSQTSGMAAQSSSLALQASMVAPSCHCRRCRQRTPFGHGCARLSMGLALCGVARSAVASARTSESAAHTLSHARPRGSCPGHRRPSSRAKHTPARPALADRDVGTRACAPAPAGSPPETAGRAAPGASPEPGVLQGSVRLGSDGRGRGAAASAGAVSRLIFNDTTTYSYSKV